MVRESWTADGEEWSERVGQPMEINRQQSCTAGGDE